MIKRNNFKIMGFSAHSLRNFSVRFKFLVFAKKNATVKLNRIFIIHYTSNQCCGSDFRNNIFGYGSGVIGPDL